MRGKQRKTKMKIQRKKTVKRKKNEIYNALQIT